MGESNQMCKQVILMSKFTRHQMTGGWWVSCCFIVASGKFKWQILIVLYVKFPQSPRWWDGANFEFDCHAVQARKCHLLHNSQYMFPAQFLQLNDILKKPAEARTAEESDLLKQSPDIVQSIEKRKKIRSLTKERLQEVTSMWFKYLGERVFYKPYSPVGLLKVQAIMYSWVTGF